MLKADGNEDLRPKMAGSADGVPIARTGAAMTVVLRKMLIWGGFTQEIELRRRR